MGLETYHRKRRFDITPEPRGEVGQGKAKGSKVKAGALRYLIQKHDATRLHYDFRLELDGVLLSWAVTRGPSLVPGEKRLAIHVEDHPLEYGDFEGTIPRGQYGGGTVMLWDTGTWTPEEDPHKGYRKGHLSFTLDGKKLKGSWHLVRMRKRSGEKQDPWLLIKSDDVAARGPKDIDILEEKPKSAATSRTLEQIAAGTGRGGKAVWQSRPRNGEAAAARPATTARAKTTSRASKTAAQSGVRATAPKRAAKTAKKTKTAKAKTAKARKARKRGHATLPDFVPPCLATLRSSAPSGDRWVHEVKFDGYRIQARLEDGKVRLLTRKGLDWAERFANVAQALSALPADTALVDGEIVVEGAGGVSDFSALQNALKAGDEQAFVYYAFDLLHLDGTDLTAAPLIARKDALAALLAGGKRGVMRLSEHFDESGPLMLKHACGLRLEGIISKRRDAPYVSGRSDIWIKAKCLDRQEFVVIGFSPSKAMRGAVGALVVGYREGGKLRYGGRVGTGYTRVMARDLWKRLSPLERKTAAVDVPPDERRKDTHWVRPDVVAEVDFRGWTESGVLRHAAFKGVREDKAPEEIVREGAMPAPRESANDKPAKNKLPKDKPAKRDALSSAASASAAANRRAGAGKPATSSGGGSAAVRLTHPDRVYWPDDGITKQELADYYAEVWDFLAPQIVGRPLSLLRCPDGIGGECFFQKHASAGLDETHLRSVIDAKKRQVIAVDDLAGVQALVQAGVLELHVRGSMIDSLETCDRIVFDLDPGEGVGWREIVAAARDVRDRLQGVGLESFVKLSGGKGLHVVLPVEGTDWDSAKTFAQALAMAMAADEPERYVARMTKSLRKGRIFIDYLRNSLEQTAVAPYSTRARPGAAVATPVSWAELGRITSANQFTLRNVRRRLKRLTQDPWAEIGTIRQRLPQHRPAR